MVLNAQIAPSNIASALAIGQQFKDFSSGAPSLQQQAYVIAQGRTGVTQPVVKFVAESPGDVGSKCGFGSPAHLIAKQLWPADGNGLLKGAVKATFYALPDGTTAAEKTVDTVGTMTQAADYQIRIADFRAAFSLAKSDTGDIILNSIKDAIESYPEAPVTVVLGAGSATAGREIGGTVSATAAAFISITDGSFIISIDGTPATISALNFSGDTTYTDFATTITTALSGAVCTYDTDHFVIISSTTGETSLISALSSHTSGTDLSGSGYLNSLAGVASVIPGTAADNILTFTAKWKGASSEQIKDVEIIGDLFGVTFITENKTTGAGDPDIQDAVDAMGSAIWYTGVINQFSTVTTLDIIKTKGDAEYQPLIHHPLFSVCGENNRTDATTLMSSRQSDKINSVICAYGCPAMTFEIGARAFSEIISRANTQTNRHYTGLVLSGLTAGGDTDEPSFTGKDTDLKNGVATTTLKNSLIELEDIVTAYRPDNEQPNPGYRWLVDIVKLQNVNNSLALKFGSTDWQGMTILLDDDISTNPNVRRVKDVKAAIFGLADSWVNNAWCTNVDFIKKNLVVVKAVGVRNRFEAIIPIKISDSLRQQDYLINFGFNLS